MLEWFSSLSLDLMIFYGIALMASAVLLLQILLSIISGGDGMMDMEVGGLDSDGLGFLSLRSVTGFFGGFGWTGVIALQNGLPLWAAVLLGIGVGGLLMLSVALLMKLLYSLRQSGAIELEASIGHVGTVYLPIPPGQSGAGKIRVMIQGRLKVLSACTDSQERIPSQKKVKVVGLIDEYTLLVTPLGSEAQGVSAGEKEEKGA